MAIDSANRLAWMADDINPPRLHRVALDNPNERVITSANGLGKVTDMTIAGPQPLGMSTQQAHAGKQITIRGLGFSGQGQDTVLLQGMPVELISSSPFHLTFRTPDYVANLREPFDAWVSVISQGRVSGPVGTPLRLAPEVPVHVFGSFSNSYGLNGNTTGNVIVAGVDSAYVIEQPAPGVSRVGFTLNLVSPSLPDGFTSARSGRRLIGHDSSGWLDIELQDTTSNFEITRSSTLTLPSPGAQATQLAVSADDRLLALADDTQRIHFFWGPSLEPHPMGAVGPLSDPVDALHFMPGGEGLIALHPGGGFSALDLQPLSAPAPTNFQACPCALPVIHDLSEAGANEGLFATATCNSNELVMADVFRDPNSGTYEFAAEPASFPTSPLPTFASHLMGTTWPSPFPTPPPHRTVWCS